MEGPKLRGKVLRGLKKALVVGLGALSSISAQEARPHPDLKKDNPQRQYLASKDLYLRKVIEKVKKDQEEARLHKIKNLNLELASGQLILKEKHDAGDIDGENGILRYIKYLTDLLKYEEEKKPMEVTPENLADFDPEIAERVQADLARIPEEVDDAYRKYDKQHGWLAGIVHSQAYGDKAMKNEGLNEEEVKHRRRAILDDITLSDQFHPLPARVQGKLDDDDNSVVRFGSMPPDVQAHEDAEKYQDTPLIIHEKEHIVTRGNYLISQKAKTLYENAFQADSSNRFFSEYISSPTELDARKRSFEYDIEKYGVWKYGEVFTEEHLSKALELRNAGKLSGDSREFLKFLKHEKIPEIMNTIAENRSSSPNEKTEV